MFELAEPSKPVITLYAPPRLDRAEGRAWFVRAAGPNNRWHLADDCPEPDPHDSISRVGAKTWHGITLRVAERSRHALEHETCRFCMNRAIEQRRDRHASTRG